MLVPWLTLFDLRSIRANFINSPKVDPKLKSEDFVILVPIWGDIKYLTNIHTLKKYPGKVILCTTNNEGGAFIKTLSLWQKDTSSGS